MTANAHDPGTCLVTGGAGFIGCSMSAGLADRFSNLVVVDNLHPQVHSRRERPAALDTRARLVIGDVTDSTMWDSLLRDVRPQVVIHLAAETGTGQSLTESTRHSMVNVVGTSQLLDGLHRNGCTPERMVLSSSRAVYGEGVWRAKDGTLLQPGQRSNAQLRAGQWDFPDATALPFRAAVTPAAPTSVYGGTKLAQEHLMRAWALAHDSSLRILRLQNVYGPGQSLSNPYTGIVSLFVRMAKQGKSIPLYEDGEMTRDFVFIDDVSSALMAAVDTPRGGFVLDVGTGVGASVRQIAELIARRYGAPAPHVSGQFRDGDVRHAMSEIQDTEAALPWRPAVSLEQGLGRLCGWIDGQIGDGRSTT